MMSQRGPRVEQLLQREDLIPADRKWSSPRQRQHPLFERRPGGPSDAGRGVVPQETVCGGLSPLGRSVTPVGLLRDIKPDNEVLQRGFVVPGVSMRRLLASRPTSPPHDGANGGGSGEKRRSVV
ncbi:unnamed protein product [Gadus morhua 'NCC']